MTPYATAVISEDGRYRYELIRRWADDPMLEWIMLNPSKADSERNDPTITRCIGFACAWGYGGIVVRNLYGLIATSPDALAFDPDPIGPRNLAYLGNNIAECTIVAWGANGAAVDWFEDGHTIKRPYPLMCLGLNMRGSPIHPLYVRADVTPQPWAVP